MAEYRTVRMAFWHDPYIEGLDAKAKLLYLYLFTCPYANNLGIVEVSRRKIAYETALSQNDIDKCLDDFQRAGKAVCDPGHNLIFLTNFIKHQTSTSPKLLEGLVRLAPSISSPVIAKALCIGYPEVYGVSKDTGDTLCIPYADGMHTLHIPSGEIGSWKGKEEGEEGKGKNTRAREVKTPPPEKVKFGQFGNVLLTEQEHAGLIEKFGESKTARMIDKLDVEISAKGYKYKSHYHAMFSWVSKAVEEEAMRGNARASPPGTQPFRSLAQMKMDANRAAADEAEILLFGNKMEAQKHAPS